MKFIGYLVKLQNRNISKAVMNGLIFIFLFTFSHLIHSQSVENVRATVKSDIIIITYDLNGNADETFNVNLYSSRDNFEKPLTLVTGDVGPNVTIGKGKRIEWLAKNELQEYTGSLIFEVKAFLPKPAFDPLELQNFSISSIKSGKSYRLEWNGGKKEENIEIFLFEDGNQKSKIATVKNDGKYLWKIPKGSKSSSYQIQLKGESGIVASNSFQIKKGFPIFLVTGGALLTGGIVTAILMLDTPGGDVNNELPSPPDPN